MFIKGQTGYRKGVILSNEVKLKMRLAKLGKPSKKKGIPLTNEQKLKISRSLKGKKHSDERKIKDRLNALGNKSNTGRTWRTEESCLPYSIDWTNTLRISIRERDKYTCKICQSKQGDIAYDVHHIDYNKKNCNPLNLVTLCRKCHMKTNHNREYWYNLLIIN